jgi:cytochrome c oxidase cbb3-type subunit III
MNMQPTTKWLKRLASAALGVLAVVTFICAAQSAVPAQTSASPAGVTAFEQFRQSLGSSDRAAFDEYLNHLSPAQRADFEEFWRNLSPAERAEYRPDAETIHEYLTFILSEHLYAYPKRTTDPAAVERGRTLYTLNGCSFCHGKDTRGGDGGPNLLRSQRVLRDQNGELIAEVVLKGVANTAMPAFSLKQTDISDIAQFLRSFEVSGGDSAREHPTSILTGDAKAGRRYFRSYCAACHSVDGDLRGLASKYREPRVLQQHWLMPTGGASRFTVVVSSPGSTPTAGTLIRIDEFLVTVELVDGTQRTFERQGAVPKVDVHDPLAAHKALLPLYADKNIHDVTAYLENLK